MNDGSYIVALQGLDETIGATSRLPSDIVRFAQQAVNKTAFRARTESSKRIREQVAFSASYLSDESGRLSVSKKANNVDLEARITGRFRPTSLARFIVGTPNNKGVRVKVAPGLARFMSRAFVIKLRAGSADIETKSNQGLAIRLRAGETISNKHKVLGRSGNSSLYLLYGPSVDQVFNNVAEDISPESADYLEAEFLRLLKI